MVHNSLEVFDFGINTPFSWGQAGKDTQLILIVTKKQVGISLSTQGFILGWDWSKITNDS